MSASFRRADYEVSKKYSSWKNQERFSFLPVILLKEGCEMISSIVCFVLGAVFPLALVSWLIVQG